MMSQRIGHVAVLPWCDSNRSVALERAVEVVVKLVQPIGSSLREQALSLPVQIREVMAHGVR
jgi:hypothetical protein